MCYCRKEVEDSRREAEKDGIKVPTTLEEYCQQSKQGNSTHESQSDFDLCDDYDENDYYVSSEDDEDMEEGEQDDEGTQCNGTSHS